MFPNRNNSNAPSDTHVGTNTNNATRNTTTTTPGNPYHGGNPTNPRAYPQQQPRPPAINSNNTKNTNMENMIGAKSVVGYLEQQKIIKELQAKLQERDDACFELSATLATVRAETAYEIKTIQTKTQVELHKTHEALRRTQQEANIAQHKISSLIQQQKKSKQTQQHLQTSPEKKSVSAAIFASSSFSKSIDSSINNNNTVRKSTTRGGTTSHRTIKTPPSVVLTNTGSKKDDTNPATGMGKSPTQSAPVKSSSSSLLSSKHHHPPSYPTSSLQRVDGGCQRLATHLLEQLQTSSLLSSYDVNDNVMDNDDDSLDTSTMKYLKELLQHAIEPSSPLLPSSPQEQEQQQQQLLSDNIHHPRRMTDSELVWQILQQCHEFLLLHNNNSSSSSSSSSNNKEDNPHNTLVQENKNEMSNTTGDSDTTTTTIDNRKSSSAKNKDNDDDVVMQDVDKGSSFADNDETLLEERLRQQKQRLRQHRRRRDCILLEKQQHLHWLYEALKWSYRGRKAMITASSSSSSSTCPSSSTIEPSNMMGITTDGTTAQDQKQTITNDELLQLQSRIRFSTRKKKTKKSNAIIVPPQQQDVFFKQLLHAKHDIQEPLYDDGIGQQYGHFNNTKNNNMYYWNLPHQQKVCQEFVQTLTCLIRKDWQTQPQVVLEALQIVQLLLLDIPPSSSLPLYSKGQHDGKRSKSSSSSSSERHDTDNDAVGGDSIMSVLPWWKGLFPPETKEQKTVDMAENQQQQLEKKTNVMDSFLEPCVSSWLRTTSFPRRQGVILSSSKDDDDGDNKEHNDNNNGVTDSMNIDKNTTIPTNDDCGDKSHRRSKRKKQKSKAEMKENHKPVREGNNNDNIKNKKNNPRNGSSSNSTKQSNTQSKTLNKKQNNKQKQINNLTEDSILHALPTACKKLEHIPELMLTFSVLNRLLVCSDEVRNQLLHDNNGKLGKQMMALVLDILEGFIFTPVGGYGGGCDDDTNARCSVGSKQQKQTQSLRQLSITEQKLIVELFRWLQIVCRTNDGLVLLRNQTLVETTIVTPLPSSSTKSMRSNHHKDQQQQRISPDSNRAPSGIAVTVRMLHHAAIAATSTSSYNTFLYGRIIIECVRLLHLILHHTQQQRELSESEDPPQQPPYTFSGLLVEDKDFYKAACAIIFEMDEGRVITDCNSGSNHHHIFSDGETGNRRNDGKFFFKLLRTQLEELAMDELEEEEILAKRIALSGENTMKSMMQDP